MIRRRLLFVLAVAALAALAVAASVVLFTGEDDDGSDAAPPAETGATQDDAGGLERCAALAGDSVRSCYGRELKALVEGAADPAAALEVREQEAVVGRVRGGVRGARASDDALETFG